MSYGTSWCESWIQVGPANSLGSSSFAVQALGDLILIGKTPAPRSAKLRYARSAAPHSDLRHHRSRPGQLPLAAHVALGDRARAVRRHARRTPSAQLASDSRAILAAGGLFIKVGQLISILSNFLPPEFRKELQGLQDRLPQRPFGEIVVRLTAEFGKGPDELFDTFDRSPIATASLAQVHAATLGDGRRSPSKRSMRTSRRIARGDLEIIRRLLKLIQFFTGVRGIESYHPEISQMIAEELDFTKEASNIEQVARNFAGDTTVRSRPSCPTLVAARVDDGIHRGHEDHGLCRARRSRPRPPGASPSES